MALRLVARSITTALRRSNPNPNPQTSATTVQRVRTFCSASGGGGGGGSNRIWYNVFDDGLRVVNIVATLSCFYYARQLYLVLKEEPSDLNKEITGLENRSKE